MAGAWLDITARQSRDCDGVVVDAGCWTNLPGRLTSSNTRGSRRPSPTSKNDETVNKETRWSALRGLRSPQ